MGEDGRGVIEQMGIVDAHHEAAALGPARQGVSDPAQEVQLADRRRKSLGKEVGEGAEGNRCACPGGDDPLRGGPGSFGSAMASRARRVLPTPAEPTRTMPGRPPAIESVTQPSSASRPSRGHSCGMPDKAVLSGVPSAVKAVNVRRGRNDAPLQG